MDLQRLRADTPAVERVLHLDNAGAALPPRPVVEAVVAHLREEEALGGYRAAEEARDRTERFYDAAARVLGCDRDEVAFVDSATRGWQLAFTALRLGPDDLVLTHRAEYASNFLAFLHDRCRVDVLPSEPDGTVSLGALERRLPEAKLVALTHVPTNCGLVNPAAEVGRRCRAAGVPFLLDACQSVGQLAVDVADIGCDLLSTTGRKFVRGPRGTGLLYVRRGLGLVPPLVDLHGAEWIARDRYRVRADARRFEVWERSVAGQIGLGVALDYAADLGLPAIERRVVSLAAGLRARLAEVAGITVTEPSGSRSGIVTFAVTGQRPVEVKAALRERGVHVSVSTRSSTLLDMDARGLDEVVRASVHYYNTDDELDRFVAELRRLVR